MLRYSDWPARLERYLHAQQGREFRWGSWDCALFVCGAIQVMTGVDPAGEFRGRYASRAEGRKLLYAAGGFAGVAEAYGMTEIPAIQAARGDVLKVREGALGLMALDGRAALVLADAGIIAIRPLPDVLRAWRV